MTVVPAQVAGVERIVVASPAGRDGALDPVLLGAAGLLEVDAFVVAGGAQAVGALAYGLPEAGIAPGRPHRRPRQRVGDRGQDRGLRRGRHRPAGRPVRGHGPRRAPRPTPRASRPTSSPRPSTARTRRRSSSRPTPPSPTPSRTAVATQLAAAARRDILAAALRDHGRIVLAPTLDAAIDFVNAYAPEHLSVDVEPLEPTVARLRNAGSIFVGPWAPESAGDYATGANHVLPTGGLARASGALAVETFGKFSQIQRIDRAGLASIRETIATLAEAEGLLAHRDAVEIRFAEPTR